MDKRATWTSQDDLEKPESKGQSLLSRYVLLNEIAEGERTLVYKASPRGGSGAVRPVALKYLKPQFAGSAECVQQLRHEAWVSSHLHHAQLTRCLEVMETSDGCCIIQDYVEGMSLESLLQAEGHRIPECYLVPLIIDVLEGLHAVHTALDDEGWPLLLAHGAVRARHVLVGSDGSARLTDLSEVRSRVGRLSSPGQRRRVHPRHMAPEQLSDPEGVDHRSDLFLVGVMLWEGLTGVSLFAAESEELTAQHLQRRPVLPPSKVGCCSARGLDAICLRALARAPEKRFDTALEMANELREAASESEPHADRAEIGKWVASVSRRISAVARPGTSWDDEPTTPFAIDPTSGARTIAPVVASEEDVTGVYANRHPVGKYAHREV